MTVYDVPQGATLLRVSEKAVRQYLKRGTLAGRKVGKRWLVTDEALRTFLTNADRTVTAS